MTDLGDFKYTIKQSQRARRMRLTIHRDGSVVATVPRKFDLGLLDKFVQQKKNWILKKVQYFLNSPLKYVKPSSKKDYKLYKDEVKAVVEERLAHFNQFYNFKYNKITIRNQKSRWGSCSRKGNLNFNYKLHFLAPEVRDYIIVHELCHLGEFNHSKKFWTLVAKTFPNHKDLRKTLKLK